MQAVLRKTIALIGFSACCFHGFVQAQALPEATTNGAQRSLSSAAIIKSDDAVLMSSQKDGKLIKRFVKEGEAFKKGDPLAEFECDVDVAEWQKSTAQLAYAEQKHRSELELNRLNSNSELDLALSKAELQAAKSEKKIRAREVRNCTLKAPYAGQLIQWHVHTHQTVQKSSDLVSIVNNDQLSIEFILPSEQLDQVSVGTAMQVYISERGREYPAKVERVVPQVDSVSRTVRVIGKFLEPSAGELWSGMSGEARLQSTNLAAR